MIEINYHFLPRQKLKNKLDDRLFASSLLSCSLLVVAAFLAPSPANISRDPLLRSVDTVSMSKRLLTPKSVK